MKHCYFCTNNMKAIDYKEVDTLKKFLGAQARISPRSKTDVCAKHQRKLSKAIKRSRFLALLPFVGE